MSRRLSCRSRKRPPALTGRMIETATCLFLLCLMSGCAHYQWRPNFKVENSDFFLLAKASLAKIDPNGAISTVVLPRNIDPRVRAAFETIKRTRRIERIIKPAEIPQSAQYTLPPGYFVLKEFEIQYRVAEIEGQVGPVTRNITKAHMLDCGKTYTIMFGIESGDWVSHSYKVVTCDESRDWSPIGAPAKRLSGW